MQTEQKSGGEKLPVVAVVQEFTYLGSKSTQCWTAVKEVKSRVSSAGVAFSRLCRRVWGSAILPISLKLRLYATLVLSILPYALAGRILAKEQINKVERFHIRCVRSIAKRPVYTDRAKHETAPREHKQHTVKTQLTLQRLQFLRPVLGGWNTMAMRSAIWSPMPWESSLGGVATARLKQIIDDPQHLLQANNIPLQGLHDTGIFGKGIGFLLRAKPAQMIKILNYDCSHLRGGEMGDNAEEPQMLQCHGCEQHFEGEKGLLIQRIRKHGHRGPRRQVVSGAHCPACLKEFDHQAFRQGAFYAQDHFQHYRCIEAKVEFHWSALASGAATTTEGDETSAGHSGCLEAAAIHWGVPHFGGGHGGLFHNLLSAQL